MTSRHFALRLMLAAAVTLCAAGAGRAQQTVTATMAVNSAVLPACTVYSVANNFGVYVNANTSTTQTTSSTIDVLCTSGTSANVTLNNGLYSKIASSLGIVCVNNAICTRAMWNGQSASQTANYLAYDIYTNSTHTTVWGGSTAQTAKGAGLTGTATVPVYAYTLIPAGQAAASPGTYNDTVTITISFQ
jgi:spore coat protein U-like protein